MENQINIIKQNEILNESSKKNKVAVYLSCGFGIICGLIFLIAGELTAGLITTILCIALITIYYLMINKGIEGDYYVPYKSFKGYRYTRDKQIKIAKISIVICVVVAILGIIFFKQFKGATVQVFIALFGLYYAIKSLKAHEDNDFAAIQGLEDIIGMEIDEHILGSYQNYDSNEKRKNKDSILAVTNRKIFVTNYAHKGWTYFTQKLSDITGIGVTNIDNYTVYLKLKFKDNTEFGIKMETLDSLTSNPNLFIKCFLMALDDNITGDDSNVSSRRRRVTITSAEEHTEAANKDNDAIVVRKIEISKADLKGIAEAEKFGSGRKLEF